MGLPMWHRLRTICRKEVIWNVVLLKAGQESTPGFAHLFVCFLTLPFFPDHAFLLLRMDTKITRKVNTPREHSLLKVAEPRFWGGLGPGFTAAICTVCLGG